MRSRFLARVVMAIFAVSGVITLSCGKTPSAPSPNGTPTPGQTQPQSASQRAALLLLSVAALHADLTTSPITWATAGGKVTWTNGPCDDPRQGSVQASLDGGGPPTSGTFLPTGSHVYEVSFSKCLVDGWAGWLDGVASVAYSAAEWSNLTATVSADSMRSWGLSLAFPTGYLDVTAHGSAVWTRSSNYSTTYTPATGSRLVNNDTTNVATFGGGSYSFLPALGREEHRFDNLKVSIRGTEYTLNGSVEKTSDSFGSRTHAGEVRITSNGTLVARVYGDGGRDPRIEVLVPLVPF